jgi:hypothetical protein
VAAVVAALVKQDRDRGQAGNVAEDVGARPRQRGSAYTGPTATVQAATA